MRKIIQKGFAFSAWNISDVTTNKDILASAEKKRDNYFVLNKRSGKELLNPPMAFLGSAGPYWLGISLYKGISAAPSRFAESPHCCWCHHTTGRADVFR